MHDILAFFGWLHDHRGCRRSRKASTKNGIPDSPVDSGYGSLDESPETSPARTSAALHFVNVSGPVDGSEGDSEETRTCLNSDEIPIFREKIRAATNPNPRALGPKENGLSRSLSYGKRRIGIVRPKRPIILRPHTLDRFVPLRDQASTPAEKYRTTRQVHTLSISERLLRHNVASPDPFMRYKRLLE